MAGCKYSNPTKKNVLTEMNNAFRTLDNYLEIEGASEEVPDIFMQLLTYITKLQMETDQ